MLLRKSCVLMLLVCCSWPHWADADDSDDTLKHFTSKSDLVVSGKIVSQSIATIREIGVVRYACDFLISDVAIGAKERKGKKIRVIIKRFEQNANEKHSLIKQDAECILFLKKQKPGNMPEWETADFWFGVQQPSVWMMRSIKRLNGAAMPDRAVAPPR